MPLYYLIGIQEHFCHKKYYKIFINFSLARPYKLFPHAVYLINTLSYQHIATFMPYTSTCNIGAIMASTLRFLGKQVCQTTTCKLNNKGTGTVSSVCCLLYRAMVPAQTYIAALSSQLTRCIYLTKAYKCCFYHFTFPF